MLLISLLVECRDRKCRWNTKRTMLLVFKHGRTMELVQAHSGVFAMHYEHYVIYLYI